MKLPATNPRDDPSALWALQIELLSTAETFLGPRDVSKKIYQPQFTGGVPCIRNTPELDGAFGELSRAAESYWPTAVFEMAHETVHLLNPITGNTNNLEEGVAVAFSLEVQSSYGIHVPLKMQSYNYAFSLCLGLSRGPLAAGKKVRERVGALSNATTQDLRQLFPNVDKGVLGNLAEAFVRNPS